MPTKTVGQMIEESKAKRFAYHAQKCAERDQAVIAVFGLHGTTKVSDCKTVELSINEWPKASSVANTMHDAYQGTDASVSLMKDL